MQTFRVKETERKDGETRTVVVQEGLTESEARKAVKVLTERNSDKVYTYEEEG